MNVTTAVIFASGFGSRMLPVTAAVQKELLPILNRPIIDYVVADCVAAGVTDVIFVIRPNSHALQDYYVGNSGLQAHLKRFGKHEALAKLEETHHRATFSFVEQPETAGYGTAVPLQIAAPHLPKDEAFIVCGGDDFLWRTDGGSDMTELVATFAKTQAAGAMMALERPDAELSRYGVLSVETRQGSEYLQDFVEKPAPGEAPSNLINISKYILTPQMMDFVAKVKPDVKSGEYYITDAILAAAKQQAIAVHRASGKFLDAGNTAGWLEANLTVAAARSDLHSILQTTVPPQKS
ncbi:MAG: UTP-glucose-phosphate uridylyltransferase, UTP--glucose-phosphate uridylyltransferase [Patescibacteria group bacterium]|nr:UTP-glucose-phosphate uridylyltransferase, UTP--glucose-phosphate uridylyltransferase [Patescibacteria group bacterium]